VYGNLRRALGLDRDTDDDVSLVAEDTYSTALGVTRCFFLNLKTNKACDRLSILPIIRVVVWLRKHGRRHGTDERTELSKSTNTADGGLPTNGKACSASLSMHGSEERRWVSEGSVVSHQRDSFADSFESQFYVPDHLHGGGSWVGLAQVHCLQGLYAFVPQGT
jgi:hypothetical protein